MMNGIRLWTDAKVVKGFPRRINGSGDQDDAVGGSSVDGGVNGIAHGRDRDALRILSECEGYVLPVECAVRLCTIAVRAGLESAKGRRHSLQVLLVPHLHDEHAHASRQQLLHTSIYR